MRQYYYFDIEELDYNQIFVFGSNLSGRHGKGAALVARQKFGAEYGIGTGATGRCYAIATKDEKLKQLSLDQVIHQIDNFKVYARKYHTLDFLVTRVGCGLAGFKDSVIAPLFADAPSNCVFNFEWMEYLD